MIYGVVQFLQSGGPVLYGILVIAIILATLILDRYWFFQFEAKPLCKAKLQAWKGNAYKNKWITQKTRLAVISEVTVSFAKYRSLIQLMIIICPMLGLLGTVTGMISVFDTMAATGTGNARAMASGISMATVPTMAGMVISLIGLYFKTRFDTLAQKQLDRFYDRLHK